MPVEVTVTVCSLTIECTVAVILCRRRGLLCGFRLLGSADRQVVDATRRKVILDGSVPAQPRPSRGVRWPMAAIPLERIPL